MIWHIAVTVYDGNGEVPRDTMSCDFDDYHTATLIVYGISLLQYTMCVLVQYSLSDCECILHCQEFMLYIYIYIYISLPPSLSSHCPFLYLHPSDSVSVRPSVSSCPPPRSQAVHTVVGFEELPPPPPSLYISSLCLFPPSQVVHTVVGFEDVGGRDDFKTADLARSV